MCRALELPALRHAAPSAGRRVAAPPARQPAEPRARWTLSALAALLSERPPPQLSATELSSLIALLEDNAQAFRAELESRTARLDAVPDDMKQAIFGKLSGLVPRVAPSLFCGFSHRLSVVCALPRP